MDAVAWSKKNEGIYVRVGWLDSKGLLSLSMDEVKREAYADQWSDDVSDQVDSFTGTYTGAKNCN